MSRTHRVLVALLLGSLLLTIPRWVVWHPNHDELRNMQSEVEGLRARTEALRAENASLLLEIEALSTDPRALERRARTELSYVRTDEILFLFTEGEHAQP